MVVFLQARLSAGDNATHKYFNASHMLGSTAHESIHKAESMMVKTRWAEDGDAHTGYTIPRKKFKFLRKFHAFFKFKSIFLFAAMETLIAQWFKITDKKFNLQYLSIYQFINLYNFIHKM